MNKELIKKINEFAKKEKEVGLNSDEKKERDKLRKEYIKLFRKSFKKRLDNIEFKYIDGGE